MIAVKQFVLDQFVDESCRQKALVRYNIKQLEDQLQRLLGGVWQDHMAMQESQGCCMKLVDNYNVLLVQKEAISSIKPEPRIILEENTINYVYKKIQELRQELGWVKTYAQEIKIIQMLKYAYSHLHSLLKELPKQSDNFTPCNLVGDLKILVETKKIEDWLSALVAFANELSEKQNILLPIFSKLANEELLGLSDQLASDEIIAVINAIFYYKLKPEALFSEAVHPEKLVSIKNRITMLYHFIETIYQTLAIVSKQRGIKETQDYLFHGDELPTGISIILESAQASLIALAIKEWRSQRLIYSEDLTHKNKLYDLFRAYKFWFNPNRLIDTAMILQRQLVPVVDDNSDDNFFKQMVCLYRQLSTTECLDLYGYFANKDSCYLMRTLSAISQGQIISSVPVLNFSEQKLMVRVYNILDSVMAALREELFNRHITTVDYVRDCSAKLIQPGRRNLNAIKRIIELYSDESYQGNDGIERLFMQLEKN